MNKEISTKKVFKGVKIITAFSEAAFPPNCKVNKDGRPMTRGKQITFSLGAIGSEKHKENLAIIKEINTKTSDYLEAQGEVYVPLHVKPKKYLATIPKTTVSGKRIEEKFPVNDYCFVYDITRAKEINGVWQEVENYNSVVPKVLLNGKETDMFPYGLGDNGSDPEKINVCCDTVDIKVEFKLYPSSQGFRYAIIVHEINITELRPRTGGGGKRQQELPQIENSDDLIEILSGISDDFEVEVKPKKEEKKETKKTTAKPKTDKVDDEVSVDDIDEEDDIWGD